MKKNFYYITLTLLFILSCNEKDDFIKLNSQKTEQLISEILSDSSDQYTNTNCISEKFKFQSTIPPGIKFENYVKNELEIESSEFLESQLDYYKEFKIDSSLAQHKRIITKEKFQKFEKESEKGNFRFWNWLDKNCDNGYVSISRPIFNEDFTKALVIIGNVSCPQCGGGEIRIYEFKNGKWKIIKTSNEWIS